MKFVRNHWPVLVAVIVLWITLAALVRSILIRDDGHLVYVLDDPYIHMAVAKNLAEHGVWGVTKHEFTSATSSMIWPLLLALVYKATGPNEVTPFALNVLLATGFLCMMYVLWRKCALPQAANAGGLIAMVFVAPLAPLALCAQEHILHCLLEVSAVYLACKLLSEKEGARPSYGALACLLLLFPLLTMTRYESLFIVLVVCLLFAARGRMGYGFLLGGAGVLPAIVYGTISTHNGWGYLPNPILLKGNTNITTAKGLLVTAALLERQLMQNPLMFLVLAGCAVMLYLLYAKTGTIWGERTLALGIVIPLTLMQVAFARTGWFFRYEAYIITLFVFAIVAAWNEYSPGGFGVPRTEGRATRYIVLACVFVLSCLPLLDRVFWSLWETPRGSNEVYEQQYQMATFLREYYEGESVAANDIGAINYFADVKCLDLYGLADVRVARAMKAMRYNTAMVSDLAKSGGVKVAIVYDEWFREWGGVPKEWIRVGQWTIGSRIVCGSNSVSIYAVDPTEVDNLAQNLAAFAPELPQGVAQSGTYTELAENR